MRQFILAFTVLSILVMAQNVVAITPAEAGGSMSIEVLGAVGEMNASAASSGKTPEPISLGLLVAGLSGLAAAGDRSRPRREAARP